MGLAEKIFNEFNTGNAMADDIIIGHVFEYKEVPLDAIEPHPENRALNEQAIQSLAESIQKEGLGQPPLVRTLGPGRYQMIAGEHRLEAYKLLFEKTGDDAYAKLPVNIKHDCDDDTAYRLLWATNVHSVGLTQEERGKAFEALGLIAQKVREENPEKYKGVKTNAIIAELASDADHSVSESGVKRARRAYKESLEQSVVETVVEEDEAELNQEAERVLEALSRVIDRVDTAIMVGSLRPVLLRPYVSRLRALSKTEV